MQQFTTTSKNKTCCIFKCMYIVTKNILIFENQSVIIQNSLFRSTSRPCCCVTFGQLHCSSSTRESCWLRGRRRAAARGVILCKRMGGNRILIDCEHVWWQCCFYLESIQWDSGQRSHACFDGAKAFSSTATLEPLATCFLKKNAASLASHRTKRSPSALLHCTLTHAECPPFFLPSF